MRAKGILLPALIALAFGACSDSFSGPNDGQPRLTIQLTDAPGDLAEAYIKIEKFVLFRDPAGGGPERVELAPTNGDWIELLVLAGGKLLNVVDEAVVPAGQYLEVRMVMDEAWVKLHDGRVYATPGATLPAGITPDGELKCPSCAQSGFKVKFNDGGLVVDDVSIVVIDFDAASSFGHEAGKSGMWIMHPVLRATASNIPFGHIKGNVTLAQSITIPACGGQANTLAVFKPTAANATDTYTGTTDDAGLYHIANLIPGAYAMGHVLDVTFSNGDSLTIAATPTPAMVNVTPGDTANANYQITAATCH